MKKLMFFLATVLVGISVGLTYHFFEAVVSNSIDRIWYDWLNTDSHRLLIIPASLVLGLAFFGVQHLFDPKSEKHESHGLGEAPQPSVINFAKIIGVGFVSLVAGASLGPEAILVPASMVVGGYIGSIAFKKNESAIKTLAMAGFIALFAAFFHSFLIGVLSILLVKKQTKMKVTLEAILIAVLASGSCALVVKALSTPAYFNLPSYTWSINFASFLMLFVLLLAGGASTYFTGFMHYNFEKIHQAIVEKDWWYKASVAALGLSILYLLGGHLVEFTGNKSIVPMLHQAPTLGFIGLVWVLLIKSAAIGWSKASGYRGGMIFPTIFVCSVLVAIAQIFVKDVNFIYGLLIAIAGAIVADSKVKVLL